MGPSTPPRLRPSGPGLPLALPWIAGSVVLIASLFVILVNAAINDLGAPPMVTAPTPPSDPPGTAAPSAPGDVAVAPSGTPAAPTSTPSATSGPPSGPGDTPPVPAPPAGPSPGSPTDPPPDDGDPPGDPGRPDDAEPSTETWLVTRVVDGDTFEARRDGTTITVRLAQVDAPAPDACFGTEATAWLTDTILDQQVVLEPSTDGPDTNEVGHRLRETWLGESINVESVRLGYATRQPLHASDDPDLAGRLSRAQAEAQENRRGLWSACHRPPPPPERDNGGAGNG